MTTAKNAAREKQAAGRATQRAARDAATAATAPTARTVSAIAGGGAAAVPHMGSSPSSGAGRRGDGAPASLDALLEDSSMGAPPTDASDASVVSVRKRKRDDPSSQGSATPYAEARHDVTADEKAGASMGARRGQPLRACSRASVGSNAPRV